MYPTLNSTYTLGNTALKNRIVMAPMTRYRAIGGLPNDLMAEYYRQRSSAGLIVSESISPSIDGTGYARIPGLDSEKKVDEWRKITSIDHRAGGKIFAQLMHTGRIAHTLNIPKASQVVAPSSIRAKGNIWTDQKGLQPFEEPVSMTADQIGATQNAIILAASNVIHSGFDGIELHAANGYLLEQFISPHTNKRNDFYGNSIVNRCRFLLEICERISALLGGHRVGVRLSPYYGVGNDMAPYGDIETAYLYLIEELDRLNIQYIHLVDHSGDGCPEVPISIKTGIRKAFRATLILSGG